MKINEKIRFIREFKGWSQEEMAEKLHMSLGGYANIERGETNIQYSRLEQISKILDTKLSELTNLDEKNFQIFLGNDNIENQVTFHHLDTPLQYKLEKSHLKIEQLQQEVSYLKKEVINMKTIIDLMKKT